jgi:hypothetical protein
MTLRILKQQSRAAICGAHHEVGLARPASDNWDAPILAPLHPRNSVPACEKHRPYQPWGLLKNTSFQLC